MGSDRRTIDVASDPSGVMSRAAEVVTRAAASAIRENGRFSIALSGGSTPKALYALLATPEWASRVDWANVHVFFGDERAVPPDSADSNYRMANAALLSQVPIPPNHVHRISGEEPSEKAATEYEAMLRAFFGDLSADRASSFDLLLLGMGPDGHVASLFPGTAPVHEATRWVVPNRSPAPPPERVTLTPALLNRSKAVLVLVTGGEKAARLAEVLEGPSEPGRLPAQVIVPKNGEVRWLVDRAAASKLTRTE